MPVETDTSYTADHTQTQFEGYLNDARAAAGQAAANNTSTHNGQELLFSRNGGSNPGASLDFGAGSSWWLPRMINRLRARGEVAKLIDAQFGGHTIITTRRYIFASETLGDRIMRECASDSKSKFSFNKIDEKALKEIADRIDAVHREFRKGNGDAFKVYRSFFWRDDPSKFNITPKSLKVLFNPANKAGGVARNRTFGADKRKKSAKERQVYANYQLGCAYRDGAGVQKNGLSALYYFNKAAEGGHSKAQYELAQLYLQGADGVKKNNTEAAYWLLRAAKGGNKAAQEELERIKTGTDTALKLALAKTCQAGMSGFERDVGMAAEFLLLARDEGSAKAAVQMETIKHGDDAAMQTAVGNCLKKSRRPGDFRDVLDEATAYFEPAAKAGYAEAQYEYAMRYADMSWGDHDLNEAAFWLVRAQANESIQAKLELEKIVKEGPPAFQFALAELYRNGREEINSNVEKAKSLYRRLAIAGHAEARYQYAMCLKRADRDGSKRHEVAQWLVAAEQKCDAAHKEVESIKESGDRAFLHALALSYYRGDLGSPPNFEKAAILYEQLAEADDAHGQFMYAEHLRRGLGVDEDLNKAVYWMVMASRNGSKQAQDQLNTLTRAKRSDLHWSLYELYRAGNGEIKKDISKAAYWLAIAQQKGGASAEAVVSKITEHDDPALQLALAQVYRTGKDSTGKYRATKDLNKAAYWLAMARQCGNASAEAVVSKITEHDDPALQLALAQVYRTGKDSTGKYRATKDYDLAAKLFEKLAQDDNAEAQYWYSRFLMAGDGVEENPKQAAYWLVRAASAESDDAHLEIKNIIELDDIEEDNAEFQFALAEVLRKGVAGVGQNANQAARLYKKLTEADHVDAQYQYAMCLKNADGVERDYADAAYWLVRAADKESDAARKELASIVEEGDPELQFKLAQCYDVGWIHYNKDIKPNAKQAARLYEKAAQNGHAGAQYQYAKCLMDGGVLEQNKRQAVYWLALALQNGSLAPKRLLRNLAEDAKEQELQWRLYELYSDERGGIKQDIPKAAYWLAIAKQSGSEPAETKISSIAEKDDPAFQYQLAQCYRTGRGAQLYRADRRGALTPNLEEAARLYEKAMQTGHVEAQYQYAMCMKDGDGIEQKKQAASFFEKLAKDDHAEAQYQYAKCLMDGVGVEKNPKGGVYWLALAFKGRVKAAKTELAKLANSGGNSELQWSLYELYRDGPDDLEPDANKAVRWLMLASKAGSDKARQELESIGENGNLELGLALAQLYSKGPRIFNQIDFNPNPGKAADLYERLAKAGSAEAQYQYSECLIKGRGRDDPMEGVYWLALASERGNKEAKTELSELARKQLPILYGRLYELYRDGHKAIEQDMSKAAYWLAVAEQNNNQDASKKISSTAVNDDVELQFTLAELYRSGGDSLRSNPGRAAIFYEKAAQANHPEAQYHYAMCLMDGFGTRENKDQAIHWLHQASEKGVEAAKKKLAELAQAEEPELQ